MLVHGKQIDGFGDLPAAIEEQDGTKLSSTRFGTLLPSYEAV